MDDYLRFQAIVRQRCFDGLGVAAQVVGPADHVAGHGLPLGHLEGHRVDQAVDAAMLADGLLAAIDDDANRHRCGGATLDGGVLAEGGVQRRQLVGGKQGVEVAHGVTPSRYARITAWQARSWSSASRPTRTRAPASASRLAASASRSMAAAVASD